MSEFSLRTEISATGLFKLGLSDDPHLAVPATDRCPAVGWPGPWTASPPPARRGAAAAGPASGTVGVTAAGTGVGMVGAREEATAAGSADLSETPRHWSSTG